jgi:hypothetical protein
MTVELTIHIDENAKVLPAGAEDRAVVPVQVEVENRDAGHLVLALENLRFELHDARGTLLEVLAARPMAVAATARELRPGAQDALNALLVVNRADVRSGVSYQLCLHAFGETRAVEFRFQ